MGDLFGKPKTPEPEPPATMPDPYDAGASDAKRKTARSITTSSSTTRNSYAPTTGVIGREYTRSKLGSQ